MGIETTQNFYADFEAVEKNLKNLLTKMLEAKRCAKFEFVFRDPIIGKS